MTLRKRKAILWLAVFAVALSFWFMTDLIWKAWLDPLPRESTIRTLRVGHLDSTRGFVEVDVPINFRRKVLAALRPCVRVNDHTRWSQWGWMRVKVRDNQEFSITLYHTLDSSIGMCKDDGGRVACFRCGNKGEFEKAIFAAHEAAQNK